MRDWLASRLVLAIAVLFAACTRQGDTPSATGMLQAGAKGRFVGVGIYEPGAKWTQLKPAAGPAGETPVAANAKSAAPQTATRAAVADDEQVIVVVDTATGEVRQCGNFSGHCIGYNPWRTPVAAVLPTPIFPPVPEERENDMQRGANLNSKGRP